MERIMEPDPSKHFWPEHFFHGYHTINDVFDDVSEKYVFKINFNHVTNVKILFVQDRYTTQPCLNETKRWTRFDRKPCIDAVLKHNENYKQSLSCKNADCGINTYDFGLGGNIKGKIKKNKRFF